jgi:hypothetical protein
MEGGNPCPDMVFAKLYNSIFTDKTVPLRFHGELGSNKARWAVNRSIVCYIYAKMRFLQVYVYQNIVFYASLQKAIVRLNFNRAIQFP